MMWWTKSRRAQNVDDYETWISGGVVPTLNVFDNASETRATVLIIDEKNGGNVPMIFEPKSAFEENWAESEVKNALRANASKSSHAVLENKTVRRLTPVECERLQGFPDDWTSGQADSNRYKQMGNAVAVPVVEWVVTRMVAQLKGEQIE